MAAACCGTSKGAQPLPATAPRHGLGSARAGAPTGGPRSNAPIRLFERGAPRGHLAVRAATNQRNTARLTDAVPPPPAKQFRHVRTVAAPGRLPQHAAQVSLRALDTQPQRQTRAAASCSGKPHRAFLVSSGAILERIFRRSPQIFRLCSADRDRLK